MSGRRASSASGRDRSPSPDYRSNPNVFDDAYASSIHSDFPRPHRSPSPAASLNRHNHLPSNPESIADAPSDDSIQQDLSSNRLSIQQNSNHDRERLSISKAGSSENPFHDSHEQSSTSNSSGTAFRASPIPQRTISSASSFSYARTQSPVPENLGPSHPYGMYPQDLGISRSASVATASTRAASQSFASRNTPAHPYGLYPQGISDGDEDEEHAPPTIPVGFPGHGNTYHRRIGPEGEEQDIIGADGHTEQLPPYSRYPVEPAKVHAGSALSVIGEGQQQTQQQPQDQSLTSAPITSYQESQSPQSQIGPGQPPPIGPTVSGSEPDESGRGSGSSVSEVTEKSWSEKTWREKRRTKVVGLPLWLLIVLLVAALALATIVGAVIGGVVGTADAKDESDKDPYKSGFQDAAAYTQAVTVTTTMTTLIDATPLTTTTMAPPPLGTYDIPVVNVNNEQDTCLQGSQANAWDCRLTSNVLEVQVNNSADADCPTISFPYTPSPKLKYGAQPPMLGDQNLTLVKEIHNETNGPAYHFQTAYDKLVVIHEWELKADDPTNYTVVVPRGVAVDDSPFSSPLGGWLRKGTVQAGTVVREFERPWFCWFNATFIEGFIFMLKDLQPPTTSLYPSTTSSYAASGTATPGYPFGGGFPVGSGNSYFPPPSPLPTSTPAPTEPEDPDEAYELDDTGYGASGEGGYGKWNGDYDDYLGERGFPTQPSSYPKLFKIEERRVPPPPGVSAPPATCVKMAMDDQGHWKPYNVPVTGNTQTVVLQESDPNPLPTGQPGAPPPGYDEGQWESGCYCRWENM